MRPLPLLLLVVALTAGCGSDPSPQAAEPTAVPTPTASGGGGSEQVELGTDGGFQWRLSVAPDGRSALFAHGDGFFPQTRESTIYEVQREGDGWSDPVEVSFAGPDSSDIDPVHSADGTRVWFSSIRPLAGVPRTDVDVWFVDRRPDGSWGEPENAGAVNTEADELYPSIGPDGSLYVGSDRSGQGFDLVRAAPGPDGTWAAAQPLPAPVTTDGWEFNPAFTADGKWLVFTARSREGGAGEGDLFATRPGAGGWSDPIPLAEVNTSGDEYHPSFAPDGELMHFVRGGRILQVPLPVALRSG